ncbi:MAG: hypothetical protein Q4E83_05445 [bacterium]|nr:hypothetical protein [bacterium]
MNTVSYPNQTRNYCVFDEKRINPLIEKKENSLSQIKTILNNSNNEDEILEALYALNLMLDNGTDKTQIAQLYPQLSKFNNTKSPNIQTFLAGIYRKTKVPDAFGPLCSMLIKNSINPPQNCHFDPNEEIGGAILDYLA